MKIVTIYRSLMAKESLVVFGFGEEVVGFCCLGRDGLACGVSAEAMTGQTYPHNSCLEGWRDLWDKEMTRKLRESLPSWNKATSLGSAAVTLNDNWEKRGLSPEEFITFLRPVFREAGRIIRYYPNR